MMIQALRRAQRLLGGPLVDEPAFRVAYGAGSGDLNAVRRYLATPLPQRPPVAAMFDVDWYLARNPDVMSEPDPLLHFLDVGIGQWRDPHPLIELHHIAAQDAGLLGETPTAEGLATVLNGDLVDPSPFFDLTFYASQLPPGERRPGLLRHFLTVGLAAGLLPDAYLDPAWYARTYPDAPTDIYEALRDFVHRGDAMGRSAGPAFDGSLYRRRYTDVADAKVPPLRHYLSHGRAEGRQAPRDRPAPTLQAREAALPVAANGPEPRTAGLPQPIEAGMIVARYADLARRLADQRQARKDLVEERAPPMLATDDPAATLRGLKFERPAQPRVSILIPTYDAMAHTAACLRALAERRPVVGFEVVVVDDGSREPSARALTEVPGLVVEHLATNRGFIRACNAGFSRCVGEYVLLLNNDAQPLDGAIDALVAALDADPGVGAVGPKLLYPNGRLQEAGCFLRPNGESEMVGLFDDPDAAEWCHDRDVTYCSGAALMVRRALVGDTLFDEAFLPAYCEDADLCLRLIAGGARVRYIHSAVVVHHLSVSTGRAGVARRMRQIVRNQAVLADRWGERLRAIDRVRMLAFYLPQFHPTPENDVWWGRGFTEWTNVARARPSYAGHYQPHLPADLGFYDLRLADSMRRQADLAARYGIEGFCVYHYNFGARRMLSTPMDVIAANPDIAFRHCLCWANENWTRHWDGGSREVLLAQEYDRATLDGVIADILRAAADPRYIRVDGKPLFLVYRPLLIPEPAAFAAAARAAFADAGHPGVHLVYVESMEAVDAKLRPADIGFDAAVEFPPHGRAMPANDEAAIVKQGWTGYRYDYARTVLAFLDRPGVPYARYPAVFPSWDNTPRQPLRGTSFDGAEPELFGLFVAEKIEEARRLLPPNQSEDGGARILFVNAWNEWAEGAHLEPDGGFGHRWLEALRDAQTAKAWC